MVDQSHVHSRSSSRSGRMKESKRARSRSTDHINNVQNPHTELNSMSIRKMLRPVHTAPDSPVTSPENARHHMGHGGGPGGVTSGSAHAHKSGVQSSTNTLKKSSNQGVIQRRLEKSNSSGGGCMSEPEFYIDNNAPAAHSRQVLFFTYLSKLIFFTGDLCDWPAMWYVELSPPKPLDQ